MNLKNRISFLLIILSIFLVIVFIFYELSDILWPFAFAFIFAYLLHPVVHHLGKNGLKKGVLIGGIFLIFPVILILAGNFLFSAIRTEIPVVQEKVPVYIHSIQRNTIPSLEKLFHIKLSKDVEGYITHFTEKLLTFSPGIVESITNFASQAFSRTVNIFLFLFNILLIPVILVYFLIDFDKIKNHIPALVPETYQDIFIRHLGEINQILIGFFGGQLLISLVLSVFYMIGLTAIGVDLAVILGLFSGFINIIPYIGVLTGGIISTLFALFKYQDVFHTMTVICLYILGHLLDGYFLNPRIVGHKIGLHPLLVILSLLLGGKLFGFIGIIFAVPVAAIINHLFKAVFKYYKESEFYQAKP